MAPIMKKTSKLPALSSERMSIVLTTCALAVFLLATGLAPGRSSVKTVRGLAPGKSIPVSLTLVTADSKDLACAGDMEIGGARCAFRSDGGVWPGGRPERKLAPYMTVDNALVLIPDLWSEPALAARLKSEPPSGSREALKRFTARCQLTGEARAEKFYVRWNTRSGWSYRPEAWVGRISGCTIEG